MDYLVSSIKSSYVSENTKQNNQFIKLRITSQNNTHEYFGSTNHSIQKLYYTLLKQADKNTFYNEFPTTVEIVGDKGVYSFTTHKKIF